jgi:hypothetical protein
MAAKKTHAKTVGAKKTSAKTGRPLLIQNYGLFWRGRDVFWGEPGKSGNLLGLRANSRSSEPIDFREQTGIYVLYADYHLLYVGQAGYGNKKLFDRLRAHRFDHLAERWNRFSWFGLRWVKATGKLSNDTANKHPTIPEVLNHLEAVLISATEPALNRQGGRWGQAVQYLQFEDPDMEPHHIDMIRALYDFVIPDE